MAQLTLKGKTKYLTRIRNTVTMQEIMKYCLSKLFSLLLYQVLSMVSDFCPRGWDSKFEVLFQLARFFFKKGDFLSILRNNFFSPSLALCSFKFLIFLPSVQWHFFCELVILLYFTQNGRLKENCQELYSRSRRKGKIRMWNFLRLGPGFESQETVTFEHHFWCAKIICGRIL